MERSHRLPRIIVARRWTLDGQEYSDVENPSPGDEFMAFADAVKGDAGARVVVSTDFGMKDYGNGPSGSVSVGIDCNQDDQTIAHVAKALSLWSISFAEEHFKAADQKYQQMATEKHPEKSPTILPGPPPFKP